ncbi:MAG: efflux RND transporter periplasmic adaptor subunit [Hyphomicrobium sp.]
MPSENDISPNYTPPVPKMPKRRIWPRLLTIIAIGGGAAYVAVTGISSRETSFASLRDTAESRALPTVYAAKAALKGNTLALDLPGRLEAHARAALFARVNGYLSAWKADIGTPVKAGDLLAEIEAPELDQQLLQAQSDLANAQASASLADITNDRFQALLKNKTISRQSGDEKTADLAVKKALVTSAEANVERLRSMTLYKRIVAPFDGVVTARNTDVGALINSGSASGSELFVVSNTKKLRLTVNVPQTYAPLVKIGAAATLTLPESPGKTFAATVEATSGAVDVASGTMRTQLGVDNAAGLLMPGAYASVRFEVTSAEDVFTVPASAVIFDKGGLRVATVDDKGRVILKPITIARDYGKTIEIGSGLTRDDNIVVSPPDGVVDGDMVNVKAQPPEK